MPFAAYVLEEDAERVFEINAVNRYAACLMTITCAVRPEWRTRIPAVVHIDNTARPQIVRDADTCYLPAFLCRFRDRTGKPGVPSSRVLLSQTGICGAIRAPISQPRNLAVP